MENIEKLLQNIDGQLTGVLVIVAFSMIALFSITCMLLNYFYDDKKDKNYYKNEDVDKVKVIEKKLNSLNNNYIHTFIDFSSNIDDLESQITNLKKDISKLKNKK